MSGLLHKYRPVTHCIFDLDGLILDTETLAFQVTQNILNRLTSPPRTHLWEVKESLLGLQAEDVARRIVDVYDLPITWQEYRKLAREEAHLLMQECRVCEGAERLIYHLFNNSIPICIATSSSKESFAVKSKNFKEMFRKFEHVVTGASDKEVTRGKPAPDIFEIAARRFADSPRVENCLVFEDSPSGVKAGLAAGMQVVAVPDYRVARSKVKNATVVLKSLKHFRPEEFGLPPFDEE